MTDPQLRQASRNQVRARHLDSLTHALGPTIAAALADDGVVEVMANPDGGLWVDRAGSGRHRLGELEAHAAETVIRLLANHMGEPCGRPPDYRPSVAGTLPGTGERFQGVLPPIVERPSFTIRKRPKVIYTLDDYLTDGTMTPAQADEVRAAITDRKNILVAGGTGSGKTTLANAILAEPAFRHDRVVILEDTRELQCAAEDRIELLTRQADPPVTMRDLLKMTLRFRPDRIVVGEVRGGEALDMLKAWNTGHPGGVATVHANSAQDAARRVADLVAEVSGVDAERLIATTIGITLFLQRSRDHQQANRRTLTIAHPQRLLPGAERS